MIGILGLFGPDARWVFSGQRRKDQGRLLPWHLHGSYTGSAIGPPYLACMGDEIQFLMITGGDIPAQRAYRVTFRLIEHAMSFLSQPSRRYTAAKEPA